MIEVNGPSSQQEEYKYTRVSSLENNPLPGAQLDASLNSAHHTPASIVTANTRLLDATGL